MESTFENTMIILSFSALLMALLITLYRLMRGPSSSDRIIALDLVVSVVMGFILLYSVLVSKEIYVDIAIVISLISFMGTISISIYLRHKK
ncbi:MAG: monovalent cation/H+ antiporter complex subunit F [Bacteroidales bacterium]|nr:monovalent cation/H+ antiporter complex subunit F [Bacteroidales bacterium]MDT8432848.1 monovalent cation/H+ antiporter complex subunit F [Bacteroidales bacterium]